MDRDELQERIRARRSGGDPYRRGTPTEEFGAAAGYQRFQPEPEDSTARRGPGRAAEQRRDHFDDAATPAPAPWPPPDLTREPDGDWPAQPRPTAPQVGSVAPAAPPDVPPLPAVDAAPAAYHEPRVPIEEPQYVDNLDDESAYEYDEAYDGGWEAEPRRRSSGTGALAIVGFLALGVMALLGGAVLAGVFGNGDIAGGPTPTPIASLTPSAEPTPEPTVGASGSVAPGNSVAPTDGPVTFPDGFRAEAQPCVPGSAGPDGCDSNGATNSGSLWVWVGFTNGTEDDVISATVLSPDGARLGEGSIDLARIGCVPDCPGGWTYFPFSVRDPGQYTVRVTRNGELADEIGFEVN
jgi:hypothetical protein